MHRRRRRSRCALVFRIFVLSQSLHAEHALSFLFGVHFCFANIFVRVHFVLDAAFVGGEMREVRDQADIRRHRVAWYGKCRNGALFGVWPRKVKVFAQFHATLQIVQRHAPFNGFQRADFKLHVDELQRKSHRRRLSHRRTDAHRGQAPTIARRRGATRGFRHRKRSRKGFRLAHARVKELHQRTVFAKRRRGRRRRRRQPRRHASGRVHCDDGVVVTTR
mmetsp:Transcript_3101/g.11206  ORF Transcript_3101/g.11206 Transcript_3101/m.11206 type:complete len:220 (+) Transcript_3101:5298-5957(+)